SGGPAGGGDDNQPAGPPDKGEGGGMVQASADEDSPPAARIRKAPPKKVKKKTVDEENENGEEEEDEDETGGYKIYISFSLGSGAGIASGNGELNPDMHVLKAAGFAPAQLGHITPEVGLFLNPSLLLSARLRLQYVSGLTGEPPAANGNCGSDNYCTPASLG